MTRSRHPITAVEVARPGETPTPFSPPPIPADVRTRVADGRRGALPNLFIVGAGKCGTSALHGYLARHPEISMSTRKELHLFGGPRWLERLPSYADHFDERLPVRGESSPGYSMDPFIPQVPEQMAAVLDAPRFIYLVADPVRRVVAHWAEQQVLRNDLRGLQEALADAENPFNPHVAGSRYGHQLGRYAETFGRERILVVDQLDLRERRKETLRKIFSFLDVGPDFWSPDFEVETNTAEHKLVPNRLGDTLLRRFGSRPDLAKRVSLIRGITARPLVRPALERETHARLADILAPDLVRFRALVGSQFAHWPV